MSGPIALRSCPHAHMPFIYLKQNAEERLKCLVCISSPGQTNRWLLVRAGAGAEVPSWPFGVRVIKLAFKLRTT